MEHEDRPLVGRQPAEPAFEQVPVGDGEQLVGRRRSVDRQHPEVRGSATLARRLADADVDEEALEPRIEAVRIAESPQVTPGDHQRVLEGILGPIDVAQDPLGDREQPVAAGRGSGRHTPPDPRLAPPRRDRDPRILPLGGAHRGRRPTLLVVSLGATFILWFAILGSSRETGWMEGSSRVPMVRVHPPGGPRPLRPGPRRVGVRAFQMRTLRDPDVVARLPDDVRAGDRAAYVGLLVLLIGGAGAATVNGLLAAAVGVGLGRSS